MRKQLLCTISLQYRALKNRFVDTPTNIRIPAIVSIIAFLLTENMRNPMVFVDRWTWLMVLIALVQVIVCIFARKEKEEPDDNAQTPAQA